MIIRVLGCDAVASVPNAPFWSACPEEQPKRPPSFVSTPYKDYYPLSIEHYYRLHVWAQIPQRSRRAGGTVGRPRVSPSSLSLSVSGTRRPVLPDICMYAVDGFIVLPVFDISHPSIHRLAGRCFALDRIYIITTLSSCANTAKCFMGADDH